MSCPICKITDVEELNDVVMMTSNDMKNLIENNKSRIHYNQINLKRCRQCGVVYG